jgi:hypothetical protein
MIPERPVESDPFAELSKALSKSMWKSLRTLLSRRGGSSGGSGGLSLSYPRNRIEPSKSLYKFFTNLKRKRREGRREEEEKQ